MPIYEYRCEDCGSELEKLQRISDEPLRDCPACGKPALKRLISAAGFRLKGGGWYETDFKKDNRRNLAGDGEASKGGKSDGADKPGKKDTKPDGKAKGGGDSSTSGAAAKSSTPTPKASA